MFTRKPAVQTPLDDAIDLATRELITHDAESDEYRNIVNQLTALHAIKTSNKSDRVSKDTLAMILGNLAGIVVIVGYEQKNVITSKAIAFLGKLK